MDKLLDALIEMGTYVDLFDSRVELRGPLEKLDSGDYRVMDDDKWTKKTFSSDSVVYIKAFRVFTGDATAEIKLNS